ncbi:hypothetical protein EF847_01550 [Actinobacteria bacterium YIM 96077]|uniref:Uncharacterized protein n=1 Tax=Phytoactinopolyspora halophila TaxID=1981511 RepID=A0A329QIJ9_9ACTN|nr:hypothetical protein EF847_01550 [Actinobacteria bacterium YIM 96077]RAW11152.1 hypothetical protein DPM12_17575 [Phytoactinopolyspora halophila]
MKTVTLSDLKFEYESGFMITRNGRRIPAVVRGINHNDARWRAYRDYRADYVASVPEDSRCIWCTERAGYMIDNGQALPACHEHVQVYGHDHTLVVLPVKNWRF